MATDNDSKNTAPAPKSDGAVGAQPEGTRDNTGAVRAEPQAFTEASVPEPPDDVGGEELELIEAELAPEEVRAVVEALIFASPQPLTGRQIGQVLPAVPKTVWTQALEELRVDYGQPGRGLQLVEVASGFQITTRPEYNDWLRELLDPRAPGRLSIQALETLAVIAYKQPVTQPEVIELRGVKSGGVVKTLLEKRLIRIVGRKEVVGRPMLYGTSKHFLLHFGLKDLSELPKIEEFAEVLGEEVDIIGLKRAIEAPTPAAEVELSESEASAPREETAGNEEADAAKSKEKANTDEVGR